MVTRGHTSQDGQYHLLIRNDIPKKRRKNPQFTIEVIIERGYRLGNLTALYMTSIAMASASIRTVMSGIAFL